jgi:hypothetical protein
MKEPTNDFLRNAIGDDTNALQESIQAHDGGLSEGETKFEPIDTTIRTILADLCRERVQRHQPKGDHAGEPVRIRGTDGDGRNGYGEQVLRLTAFPDPDRKSSGKQVENPSTSNEKGRWNVSQRGTGGVFEEMHPNERGTGRASVLTRGGQRPESSRYGEADTEERPGYASVRYNGDLGEGEAWRKAKDVTDVGNDLPVSIRVFVVQKAIDGRIPSGNGSIVDRPTSSDKEAISDNGTGRILEAQTHLHSLWISPFDRPRSPKDIRESTLEGGDSPGNDSGNDGSRINRSDIQGVHRGATRRYATSTAKTIEIEPRPSDPVSLEDRIWFRRHEISGTKARERESGSFSVPISQQIEALQDQRLRYERETRMETIRVSENSSIIVEADP